MKQKCALQILIPASKKKSLQGIERALFVARDLLPKRLTIWLRHCHAAMQHKWISRIFIRSEYSSFSSDFKISSRCFSNHLQCVVPENIQTPPRREFHLGPPPPPWIFHFCRVLMTPNPLGISTSVTKTTNPSGKVHFHEERLLK